MDEQTKPFKEVIDNGCVIWPTSCFCGGRYAWLTPRPSGAHTMYGCICHNDLPKKEEYEIT